MDSLSRRARVRLSCAAVLAAGLAVPAVPAISAAAPTPTPTSAPASSPAPTTTVAASTTTVAASTTTVAASTSRPAVSSPSPTPAGPRPPIVPPGQGSCQAVLFYGVRGAGASARSSDAVGPALSAYGRRLQAAYGSARVGIYAADYPAAAVADPSTAQAWRSADVVASIAAGAATAAANVTALARQCPSSTLVVAGEDEGALVVRDALAQATKTDGELLQRLGSVVLVGDPALHYADPGVLVGGGSPWASGVLAAAGPVTELPEQTPAVHVCHRGDVVCQSDGSLATHSGYAADADAVVVRVAEQLRGKGVNEAFAVRAVVQAPSRMEAGTPASFSVELSNTGTIPNPRAGAISVTLSGSAIDAGGKAAGDGWSCRGRVCTRSIAAQSLQPGTSLPPVIVTVTGNAYGTGPLFLSSRLSDVPAGGVETQALSWASSAVSSPAAPRPLARLALLTRGGPTRDARWSVTLTNTGRAPAQAPVRVDMLLSGSSQEEVTAASGPGWVCVSGTTCLWAPALDAGATSAPLVVSTRSDIASLGVRVRQAQGDGWVSEAESSLTVPVDPSAAPQPPVEPGLTVALTSSAEDGRVPAGSTVRFSAVVTNSSPTVMPTGTVVADVSSWSTGGDTTALSPSVSGRDWVCSDGNCAWTGSALAPGTSTTPLTFNATVDGSRTRLSAAVGVDDAHGAGLAPAIGSVTLDVAPSGRAHLQPALVASRKVPGLPGDKVSWTATVVNSGAASSEKGARLEFDLPGDPAEWSLSGPGWTCDATACASPATLTPGATSSPVSVVRRATTRLRGAVTLGATASETGVATVGSSSVTSTVTFGAGLANDLAVMTSGFAEPVAAGAPARTTVTVRNVGTQPVESVWLSSQQQDQGGRMLRRGTGWECPGEWANCRLTKALAPGEVSPPLTLELLLPEGDDSYPPSWWAEHQVSLSSETVDDDSSNSRITASYVVADPSVDLVPEITPPADAALRTPFDTRLVVRNRGLGASSGPIKITYTTGAADGAESTTTVTGQGWTCVAKVRTCTTDAPVAAGSSAPALTFRTVVLPGEAWFGPMVPASWGLAAQLSARADQAVANNSVQASVGLDAQVADLFGVLTPASAGVAAGEDVVATLALTSIGKDPFTDRITVDLTNRASLGRVSGAGSGWACTSLPRLDVLRCVTDADVAPGGDLPELTVRATLTGATTTSSFDSASLTARWSSAGDQLRGNDAASFTVSAAPMRSDLLPVLTGPPRAVSAGTPSSPTTTTVTAAILNAGPDSSSAPLELHWETTSSEGDEVIAAGGAGWSCSLAKQVCTRKTALASGAQTPPLTLTVRNDPQAAGRRSAVRIRVADPQDADADSNTLDLAYPVY
ncbi:MAG: cutinase family protein [Kineosporiaceae bacterium]